MTAGTTVSSGSPRRSSAPPHVEARGALLERPQRRRPSLWEIKRAAKSLALNHTAIN